MNARSNDLPPLGHPLDAILAAVSLAIVAAFAVLASGCESVEDALDHLAGAHTTPHAEIVLEEVDPATPPALDTSAQTSPDAVPFSSLQWHFGGVNGKGAALADGCRIADLRVSPSGLSYKWKSGGCETLGASGKTDASKTLACLFCREGSGDWKGGKFDYVSTSRTTRDFKNIKDGYQNWPVFSIESATEYAFVIVSTDGRKRSNVIRCGK